MPSIVAPLWRSGDEIVELFATDEEPTTKQVDAKLDPAQRLLFPAIQNQFVAANKMNHIEVAIEVDRKNLLSGIKSWGLEDCNS
jgi:hypothetical protein